MKIVKAEIEDAEMIGQVHSRAWKQAYRDIFPEEYLNEDTPDKRTEEFLESLHHKNIFYYVIYEEEKAVGIVKVTGDLDCYEISGFYILEEYRNRGFGRQAITYLREILDNAKIQLWVLENNVKARRFYENSGFKNTEETRSIYRGNDYTQLRYELPPPIWAYEMYYDKEIDTEPDICCMPFEEKYFEEYMCIYNECFYEMRSTLDIQPYNWYAQYSQMADKAENVFVLLEDNQMIGSVACYGNEIDDLIVKKSCQGRGYGKQLLLWAMKHIRQYSGAAITLHVAAWNKQAIRLYENAGFLVRKKERVR